VRLNLPDACSVEGVEACYRDRVVPGAS
jgi:hypothetical protein